MDQIDTLVLTDQTLSKRIHNQDTIPKIKLFEIIACELPFDENTSDEIVQTLVFCIVENVTIGLQEFRRVLRDDWQLIFIEHVLQEKIGMLRLSKTINPE